MAVLFKKAESKAGRPGWKIGDKHWEMHVHHNKMCARNLARVVTSEKDGIALTNAGSVGLRTPEAIFDPEFFATETLRADRAELVNRPEVGLSMAVGNLAALRHNLNEGVKEGIFHERFAAKFNTLYDKYDIEKANTMINVQDFPDADRSEGEVEKATKNILKFGVEVTNEWPKFAEYFGRVAGAYVALYSVLTLGAVTITPKYAEGLKEVPMASPADGEAKTALMGNAASASAVGTFWSKLVQTRAGLKQKRDAARAGVTTNQGVFKTLAFTPTPTKSTAEQRNQFKLAIKALTRYNVAGADASWEELKRIGSEAIEMEFELAAIDSAAAADICDFNIKQKTKELKAAMEAHQGDAVDEVASAEASGSKKSSARRLQFTPSPKQQRVSPSELKSFQNEVDELLAYDVTAAGASWKAIKEIAQKLVETKLDIELKDMDKAADICDFDVMEKAKEIKRQLTDHIQGKSTTKSVGSDMVTTPASASGASSGGSGKRPRQRPSIALAESEEPQEATGSGKKDKKKRKSNANE
jgi:hypothetical protein